VINAEDFVRELDEENELFFSSLDPWDTSYWAEPLTDTRAIIKVLQVRYHNEAIGAEVIARLMFRINDNDKLRLLVGRQVGDESKHALVVGKRIKELGGELGKPTPEQLIFYGTLDSMKLPVEFFAAQQYTVETQSLKRNEQALHTLDAETARMFERDINPDEHHHVALGRRALLHYCVTEEAQELARAACRRIRDVHVAMSRASRQNLLKAD
jgi:hypothetical protein